MFEIKTLCSFVWTAHVPEEDTLPTGCPKSVGIMPMTFSSSDIQGK